MNLEIGLELGNNDVSVRLLIEAEKTSINIDLYCDHSDDEKLAGKDIDVTMDAPMAEMDNDDEEDDNVVHEEVVKQIVKLILKQRMK